MNVLGLVKTGPVSSVLAAPTPAPVQLFFHDILASPGRLWVRGHLSGLPSSPLPDAGWWPYRRGKTDLPPPPLVHLRTQICGKTLEADLPLTPAGEFEASFDVSLPPGHRGWRVAHNQVEHAGRSFDCCSVVYTPPAVARVTAVILPPSITLAANGAQRLERSDTLARLAVPLRRLLRGSLGPHSLCYLACVPSTGDGRQAELALALTAMNWPSAPIVLLRPQASEAAAGLASALDRLRWLFAGAHELMVVDLEPGTSVGSALLASAPDRADVYQVLHSVAEVELLFKEHHPQPATEFRTGLHPVRGGLVTRYPLVFCHGMLATSMLRMQVPEEFNYFSVLADFLRERGFRALFPKVTPTGGVRERAEQLREQILRWTDEPVNVIAHSMGGLDARYLISRLGMADRVRSLTTISTPHHGSYVAEWFLFNYTRRVPLLLTLEALGMNVNGFRDTIPAACREFNASTPDAPGVRYFSYGGDVPQSKVTPMLRRGWALLTPIEGPNDGLVSVRSARWGEYLGSIYADHFAQTPDGLFVHPEENFDSLGFFSRLVEDLARRGF